MKITYLFGAGASRDALPIVNEIPSRLESLVKLLKTEDSNLLDSEELGFRFRYTKKELYDFLISDFQWLLDKSRNHSSIDTFAKKLFIKNNEKDLKRLKVILSIFFVLEQSRTPYDKRYDTFYASILSDSLNSFPENIRILSWNYDFQFEKAFSEYSERSQLSSNQDYLNVISKHNYKKGKNNCFSIIKINGTTSIVDKNWHSQFEFCDSIETCVSHKIINEALRNYGLLLHSDSTYHCCLSFAWESFESDEPTLLDRAIQETEDTSILIVIGYSFPYFNRDVDRKIITKMSSLQKVYFQSPQADVLKERFSSIRPSFLKQNMISFFDTEQFLLPNEL